MACASGSVIIKNRTVAMIVTVMLLVTMKMLTLLGLMMIMGLLLMIMVMVVVVMVMMMAVALMMRRRIVRALLTLWDVILASNTKIIMLVDCPVNSETLLV